MKRTKGPKLMEDLFEQRKLVASQLKKYIAETGYNKYSFADHCKVSPFDMEDLLKGKIDNKDEFGRLLQTIMDVTHLSSEDLLSSTHFEPQKSRGQKVFDVVTDIINFVYEFLDTFLK